MRPFKEHRRRGEAASTPSSSAEPAPAEEGPDIPQLKDKEEERKGAGVPWYAGSGGGPSGAVLGSGGVRVGASMMQPGFLGSGRIAAALARFFGGSGTFLGGLFASKLGSVLVLGAMLAWGGLMVAAALKLSGGAASNGVPMPVALSGPAPSGIVIDAPKDRSLGYLANANQGEIQWDQGQAAKDAAKPEEKKEEAPPAETPPEQPKVDMPDVSQLMGGAGAGKKGGLDANAFMQKLTQGQGMMAGGGGARLKEGLAGFVPQKTFGNLPKAGQLGKTAAMRRNKIPLRAGGKSTLKAMSDRAMGQLKFAKKMSGFGANTAMDSSAKQYSTDAFEQGKTIAGNLGSVGDGGGIVVPPGDGAPGITDTTPDVPPGTNVTPYQPQVDAAKNMDNNSSSLKMLGMMLIAMGIALIMAGIALLNCTTFPIGWALIGAGVAMLLMGIMMLAMSGQQAQGAKNQGKQIEDQYGQKDQAGTISDCADEASGGGIKADNCVSGDGIESAQKAASNDVHSAVVAESNATYQFAGSDGSGGGGGGGGKPATGGNGTGRDGAGLK